MSGQPQKITIDERFRQMAADYKAGKLPIEVIANEYRDSTGKPVATKTVRRTIERMLETDLATTTYRDVEKWADLPRIKDFENFVRSRGQGSKAQKENNEKMLSYCERIWTEAFEKKNIALLSEPDIVKFLNWKETLNVKKATKFNMILACRLFLRFGYGGEDRNLWLEGHLTTKGKKGDPRIPPELKVESLFRTVMPKLYRALSQLYHVDGKITEYQYDAQHMAERLKSTMQIRTGDKGEERELWGMRINNPNNGRTSLIVDELGQVQHLTAFCKAQETWEIPREAFIASRGLDRVQGIVETECPLLQELEGFIKKYQLKNGDYLINEKQLSSGTSNRILDLQCEISGFSDLNLHDFRKVSATSLALADVRVEEAINFGVGWLDAATYIKHYLTIKGANMKRCYDQLSTLGGS